MTTNPTPEEILQVAQSGNTGQVKSLTDLRFEKFEKRLEEFEKINAQLRAENEQLRSANAELYSFASQVAQEPQKEAKPQPQTVPVAGQVVKQETDEAEIKAREEANLHSVLEQLGYRKSQSSNDTNNIQDGM